METSFEQKRLSRPRQSTLVSLFIIAAVYFFVGLSSTAEAQTEAQIAEAAEHHERGIELFHEGRFEESIAAFEHAESIAHSPANLMNLARCNQELGRNEQAIAHLEQYLAGTDITAEQRSRATNILEGLRASAASSDDAEATTSVQSDSGARPLAELPVEESESAGLTGPWAVLGSGLGLLLVGGILDIVAFVRSGDPGFADQAEYESWHSSTMGLAIAGDVLVGLGAAAAIGGLVWLLVARGRAERHRASTPRFHGALGMVGERGVLVTGRVTF